MTVAARIRRHTQIKINLTIHANYHVFITAVSKSYEAPTKPEGGLRSQLPTSRLMASVVGSGDNHKN